MIRGRRMRIELRFLVSPRAPRLIESYRGRAWAVIIQRTIALLSVDMRKEAPCAVGPLPGAIRAEGKKDERTRGGTGARGGERAHARFICIGGTMSLHAPVPLTGTELCN